MSHPIPETLIQEVRERAEIVDVIGEVVQLKKQGQGRYVGLCPFHGENTPSFSVSKDRQLYYCFGCGAAGNVISFMTDYEKLSFRDAIIRLAEMTNVDVSEVATDEASTDVHDPLRRAHELAARFYHHLFMNTEQGRNAFQYMENRGLTEQALLHFQIGYAPNERSSLTTLLEKREFDVKSLESGGLLQFPEDGRKAYDRFHNRVMFPLHDLQGRVIGFNGRALHKESKPKYLNSPETELFKKNEILYGFHLAKQTVRKRDQLVLFEGCMDVISAWMAGVDHGMAALGTSLTTRQAKLIRKLTENVILCYDGDHAGREAAFKNAHSLQSVGCNVLICPVPDGSDPDDYIQTQGHEAFRTLVYERSQSVTSFKIQSLRREKNLQREGEQRLYIEQVLEILLDIESAIDREYYLKELSFEFNLSMEALHTELNDLSRKQHVQERSSHQNRSASTEQRPTQTKSKPKPETGLMPAFHNAERILLKAMIEEEEWAQAVEEAIGGNFNVDQYAAIAAYLYAYYAEGRQEGGNEFVMYVKDPDLARIATEIIFEPSVEMTKEAFEDYINLVKNYPTWVEIEGKEQELKNAEQRKDIEAAVQIGNQLIALKKKFGSKLPFKRTRVR
ncbi:hypothetical protein DH09_07745 [Bacillaceae bacterium JMAK1]|nr:hypothetical protein DH09_07745 [Bacillaceae bacterium JMAK1]